MNTLEKNRTKHWDDHNNWHVTNTECHLRNRKLFEMDGLVNDINFGKYGFGTVRTVKDYEKYAGLSFKKRSVQKYTLDNKLAPNPYIYNTEKEWEDSFTRVFKHCIDLSPSQVSEQDYDFWCVAFKDVNDAEINRKDADTNEIKRLLADKSGVKIWREFNCEVTPHRWVVWPHSISKGWCNKIEGKL